MVGQHKFQFVGITLALCVALPACDDASPRDGAPVARDLEGEHDATCLMHDLNGDFRVDTDDLLEVAAAGFDSECVGCRQDLDGDGIITTDDVLEIMAGGLGPDSTGRECPSAWAFATAEEIAEHAPLTMEEAREEYADGDASVVALPDLDRPILRADGTMQVPEGWHDRVEAYASTWGEQGADYQARFVEGMMQFGGLDPDYAPHRALTDIYLDHEILALAAAADGPDECVAHCSLVVTNNTTAKRKEADSCGDLGTADGSGGESFAHCVDTDHGGTATAHHMCNWDYTVIPTCNFMPTRPGSDACSAERLGGQSCELDVSFSGSSTVRSFAGRHNYGEPGNDALSGAKASISISETAKEHEQTLSDAFVTQVRTQAQHRAPGAQAVQEIVEGVLPLLAKCNYSFSLSSKGASVGMGCSGAALAEAAGAVFDSGAGFAKAWLAATDSSNARIETTLGDFPSYARRLTIETPFAVGEQPTLGKGSWRSDQAFYASGAMASYVTASSAPDAGGSDANAEAWAAGTYTLAGARTLGPYADGNPIPSIPITPVAKLNCQLAPAPGAPADAPGMPVSISMSCADAQERDDSVPGETLPQPSWLSAP
ncbi:MAG: hypothetical protein AAF721_14025 [Myxococcota bacterium]